MTDWFRRRLSHLFSQQGFRGPVLTLLSGRVVVMSFSLLVTPILTRLYTPEEFGVLEYFTVIMGILGAVSSLRYEDALMIPEREDEAANVFWLALLLTSSVAVLLTCLLFWSDEITAFLQMPELAPWLWLTPPTLVLIRLTTFFELWASRGKQFRAITAAQAVNTTTMITTRIGAGLPPVSAGTSGLIGGFTVAYVVSGIFYLRRFAKGSLPSLRRTFSLPKAGALAVRYRRFPMLSTPSALLNTLVGRGLPFLLLPWFFDVAVVGLYGRSFAVLAIPLSLVGGAIAQVFFVHAAEALRAERVAELTEKVHAKLVMLGIFPTLALIVAGPDVLAFVLDEAWRPAGMYLRFVGLWFFLASVASPLTRLFDVLERQRADLLTSLFMFATQFAAIMAGGVTGDVYFTLLLLGAAGALARIVHIAILLRMAGVTWKAAVRPYLRYAAFSLPFLLLVAGVMAGGETWLITLAVGAGCAGYAAVAIWQDRLFS